MENREQHCGADRPEAWLRAQAERLDCDADLIAAMPIEDVKQELQDEGEDLDAFAASVEEQLRVAGVQRASAAHRSTVDGVRRGWQIPRVGVCVAAVAAAMLVLYGALWMLGRAMQPETVPLAQLGEYREFESQFASQAIEAKDARGGASFWAQAAEGASHLSNARRTTLGLFPHYDRTTVEQGVEHLQAAFAASELPPTSEASPDMQAERQPQRARMALLIAKGHLMLEDPDAARTWLGRVQQLGGSALTEEATTLLERIDAMMDED